MLTKLVWLSLAVADTISAALDPVNGNLLKPLLIPRTPASPGHLQVRKFITNHFEELGWDVEHEIFTADTPNGPLEMANIIASTGDGPARFTLSAHYDSKVEPEGFIGAIDSAVPCALLLYLAQAFKEVDLDVDFVFFDGEEAIAEWTDTDSLYGARVHAEGDHEIQTLVLLDLLGGNSAPIPSWFEETWPLFTEIKQINDELLKQGRMQNELLAAGHLHAYSGQMLDDHIPFWKKGVPCLHFIPHQFPSVWHTIDDDAAHLNYAFIRDWAVLLTEWLGKDHPEALSKINAQNRRVQTPYPAPTKKGKKTKKTKAKSLNKEDL